MNKWPVEEEIEVEKEKESFNVWILRKKGGNNNNLIIKSIFQSFDLE